MPRQALPSGAKMSEGKEYLPEKQAYILLQICLVENNIQSLGKASEISLQPLEKMMRIRGRIQKILEEEVKQ